MKYYIGVDLGLQGAISIIKKDGNLILCEPIPTISVMVGKKIRHQYDINTINEMFKFWISDYNISGAIMERLRAIPKQSAQTGFSLGGSTMLFKTLFTVYKIPYQEIEPRKWQKEIFSNLGIQYDKKTTKIASIQAAKQLFPGFNFKRTKKSRIDDNNLTDSALIAEYLRRINK